MSKSTHQVAIKGVDQTAGAFNSIAARAKATGAQIRSIMGGAIAAAGAYLSLRAIGNSIKELGKLSDLAMKAGTSVEFLTKSTTAFQVAGLNVSVESLTKAMQFLQKNTGQKGEDAFFAITKEIAAIPDAAERAQAAVKVFGRAGMELLPMVDNGQSAIEKFQALANVMPGVSSAAADAGDAAADALTIFGTGARDLMLKVVGTICAWWGDNFPGGVRAGAINAVNALEAFAKRTKAIFDVVGKNIAAVASFWVDAWEDGLKATTNLYREVFAIIKDPKGAAHPIESTKRIFDAYGKAYHETFGRASDNFIINTNKAEKEFVDAMMRIDKERAKFKENLGNLDVDDLANAFSPKKRTEMQLAGDALGTAAMKRISNQLILAGSNAERRLSVLGPTYQNEQKKQTSLLEKIAKNTEKTAESMEGGENLNVLEP